MVTLACGVPLGILLVAVWRAARRRRLRPWAALALATCLMALPDLYFLANASELRVRLSSTLPLILFFQILGAVAVYLLCRRLLERRAEPTGKPKPSLYAEPAAGLALLLLGAAGAQSLWQGEVSMAAGTLAGLGLAGLVWALRAASLKGALRYLASAEAAAVLATALLLGTVAGTLVLQGASTAEFDGRYGPLATPLRLLKLDNIFRSAPFILTLFLLGLTSVLTAYRRRKTLLQWRHFGLMLSHLAIVAILVGGFIGMVWGERGMVHLEVGQGSDGFLESARGGAPRGTKPLGFTLRLDEFHLDNYKPEYRLYTYEKATAKDESYELLASDATTPGDEVGLTEEGSGLSVRVENVYQRFGTRTSWEAAPNTEAGPARPAAHVRVERAGADPAELWLAPSGQGDSVAAEPGGRFSLRLTWDPPTEAELLAMKTGTRESLHELRLPDGRVESVTPGQSVALPDGRTLTVRRFLPDFAYDLSTRAATTRSSRPENPVLEVALTAARESAATAPARLLFARPELRRMMAESGHDTSEGLIYTHRPAAAATPRALLIVGSTAERLEVVDGEVLGRSPLTWGQKFAVPRLAEGVALTVEQPLRSARVRTFRGELPGGAPNPAVEVSLWTSGREAGRHLFVGKDSEPLRLSERRVLVYREKPGKIRNFESTLSVLQGGAVVATKTIKVNEPLSYGGFTMYQANYDAERPTYSGIEVVKDPGLWLAEAGLWLLMFGVFQTVVMRSWQPVWRKKPKTPRTGRSDDAMKEAPCSC